MPRRVPPGGSPRGPARTRTASAALHRIASRGLTRALGAAAAAALPWLVRRPGFRALPVRLLAADPPAAADIIHVLGGGHLGPHCRVDRGVQLYRLGLAPRMLLTGSEWGIDWAARNAARARQQGVPSGALLLDPRPRSTHGEAVALRGLARAEPIRSVLLVTEAFHAGRAASIFRAVLRGSGVELRSCPAALDGFPSPNWWEEPVMRALVLGEAARLALARGAGRL